MNINEGLLVSIVDSTGRSVPIADVIVDAVFFAGDQQRYQFSAGSTDANGQLKAGFDHFERERMQNSLQSIMDYNTKLEDCDSRIRLHAPSLDELKSRLNAVEHWYPDFAEVLAKRVAACNNGKVKLVDVTLTLLPGTITKVSMVVDDSWR